MWRGCYYTGIASKEDIDFTLKGIKRAVVYEDKWVETSFWNNMVLIQMMYICYVMDTYRSLMLWRKTIPDWGMQREHCTEGRYVNCPPLPQIVVVWNIQVNPLAWPVKNLKNAKILLQHGADSNHVDLLSNRQVHICDVWRQGKIWDQRGFLTGPWSKKTVPFPGSWYKKTSICCNFSFLGFFAL